MHTAFPSYFCRRFDAKNTSWKHNKENKIKSNSTVTESQNYLHWKRPSRWSQPTTSMTYWGPSLSHVPQHHVHIPPVMGTSFQCLTTFSMKKFFLTTNLNLIWHNVWPLILSVTLISGRSLQKTSSSKGRIVAQRRSEQRCWPCSIGKDQQTFCLSFQAFQLSQQMRNSKLITLRPHLFPPSFHST